MVGFVCMDVRLQACGAKGMSVYIEFMSQDPEAWKELAEELARHMRSKGYDVRNLRNEEWVGWKFMKVSVEAPS